MALLFLILQLGALGYLCRSMLANSPYRDAIWLPSGNVIPTGKLTTLLQLGKRPVTAAQNATLGSLKPKPSPPALAHIVNAEPIARPIVALLIDLMSIGALSLDWDSEEGAFVARVTGTAPSRPLTKMETRAITILFPDDKNGTAARSCLLSSVNSAAILSLRKLLNVALADKAKDRARLIDRRQAGLALLATVLGFIGVMAVASDGFVSVLLPLMILLWPPAMAYLGTALSAVMDAYRLTQSPHMRDRAIYIGVITGVGGLALLLILGLGMAAYGLIGIISMIAMSVALTAATPVLRAANGPVGLHKSIMRFVLTGLDQKDRNDKALDLDREDSSEGDEKDGNGLTGATAPEPDMLATCIALGLEDLYIRYYEANAAREPPKAESTADNKEGKDDSPTPADPIDTPSPAPTPESDPAGWLQLVMSALWLELAVAILFGPVIQRLQASR